ncbi:hypothetical protein DFH28DRAFT_923628 [Melampsora americana]|nr:hypothetical protein DFH28DRAFT_923628 [Melampsora americana]
MKGAFSYYLHPSAFLFLPTSISSASNKPHNQSQRWISPALMEPWVLTPQPPLNSPSFLDLACIDRDLDMASGHMLILQRPICEMSDWDDLFGEDEMVGEEDNALAASSGNDNCGTQSYICTFI